MFPSTFSNFFPVLDHESINGILSRRDIIVAAEDLAFAMSGAKAKARPADKDPKMIAINTKIKIKSYIPLMIRCIYLFKVSKILKNILPVAIFCKSYSPFTNFLKENINKLYIY